jgi:glutathione S-transferase
VLVLYYWPGASSVVPHIVLEEIGAPYERQLVNFAQGEHKSASYLKINSHGKVPALAVDGVILTENVAILSYLAKQFPQARLWPQGKIEEARCVSMMAWFASAVHPTFAHIIRPQRFANDTAAHASLKETACDAFWNQCKEINQLLDGKKWTMGAQYTVCGTTKACASSCRCTSFLPTPHFLSGCWNAFWNQCKEINQLLDGKKWTMGAQYTVCDPYAFFVYDQGLRIKLPMHELSAYTAFSQRMLERPAVCRVLGLEQTISRGSNPWDGPYYAQPRQT